MDDCSTKTDSADQTPPLTLRVGDRLKIVTYNVHGWEDADFRDNFDRVVEVLKSINADVICLQEVKEESRKFPSGGTLEALAAQLGGYDFIKATAASPNPSEWTPELDVVLSRFPMTNKHFLSLHVAPHQDRVAAIAEFSFYVHDADAEDGSLIPRRIGVVCTHLDHAFENIRLAQLEKLLEHLKGLDLREYILAGDFNSVWQDDFTSTAWEKLARLRKNNSWEEPRNDVVQKLLSDCGCRDSYWELQRFLAESTSSPSEFLPSRWTKKPEPTVWANTRIDFVFLSRELRMSVSSYTRIVTYASDHFPVIAELELLTSSLSTSSTSSALSELPSPLPLPSSHSSSETSPSFSSASELMLSTFQLSCSARSCNPIMALLTP